MQTAEITSILVAGALNLFLGLFVQLRDWRRIANSMFLLMSAGVALWSVGIALFLVAGSAERAMIYADIYYIAALLIVYFMALFAGFWIGQTGLKRRALIYGLPVAAFVGLIVVWPASIVERVNLLPGHKALIFNAVGQSVFSCLFVIMFLVVLLTFASGLKKFKAVKKAQLRWIFSGIVAAGVSGTLFDLILPSFGFYSVVWLGPVFSVLFAAAMVYAIVKHRMFDIRLAAARALAYGLSIVVLASGYGFIIFGLADYVFDLHFALLVQIFLSVATGVAALLFTRLKQFFDELTDKLFYQDAYDPQDVLNQLSHALVQAGDLPALKKSAGLVLQKALKPAFVRFIIIDQEPKSAGDDAELLEALIKHCAKKPLMIARELQDRPSKLAKLFAENGVALAARLATGPSAMGFIILGYKNSGATYPSVDIKLLTTAAEEIAISLQNVLRLQQIQEFNSTLQQKIGQATRELKLSNQKLRQLDETKDDFISMASHQLRTPLTSIKGYLSMVLEGDAGAISSEQKHFLSQAFSSSERMIFLITDLLDVSRLKTGKFVIEPTLVNLADIISDEIGQLQETFGSRKLSLHYHKPANFPLMNLDENKTRQVIMNFLDNAIYYTPAGGKITIKLGDKPNSVELKIIDNGIGVPRHEQHHLFTKFYRAANARTVRPDGTGLGLFMAQKVIVGEGGAIIFDSQEGRGSTFGFTFPKTAPAVLPPASQPRALAAVKN